MKKLFYFLILILIVFSWLILKNSIDSESEMIDEAIQMGDQYFNKGLYHDAYISYKSANDLMADQNIVVKMCESLINLDEYDKCHSQLNNEYISIETRENYQQIILDDLIANQDFINFNRLLKSSTDRVAAQYKDEIYFDYIESDQFFSNIDLNSLDPDKFIVKINDSWKLVNQKSKVIDSGNYDAILGYDTEYLTVQEKGNTIVYDNDKQIRFNEDSLHISRFAEGYLVKKYDDGFHYIDRTGARIKGPFRKVTPFENGNSVILDNEKVQIINSKFEIIKEFDANDFKINEAMQAIVDNKIIIKIDDKNKIIDLKTGNQSELYDDADFSNGDLIAVKKDNKWAYIDQDFNMVSEFTYDVAKSFASGIGLVELNGEQGLIKHDLKFNEAKDNIIQIRKNGTGVIETEKGYKIIRFVRFIND